MTFFGKLLVFLNLVFSVVTGALIIFVFTTRSNWVGAYNDAKVKAESAEKAYKNEKTAHDNDLKQKDATLKEMEEQIKQLNNRVATAQAEAQQARDAADKQVNVNRTASTDAQRLQAELDQIRSEREALDKEKTILRERVVAIQKELDKQREVAVQEGLRARNMEQKAHNLLRQVEELTVRNRELESAGGTGTGAGTTGSGTGSILEGVVKTAPPGVRGKVTRIGEKDKNLASVNIGSDSGLSRGNVLIVYRGNQFLGELTLSEVSPKVSVGKFVPNKRTDTVQVGDQVATSLTGTPQ
jgi:hypothetical protein